MPKLSFEDFTVGAAFDLPSVAVGREDIVAFARDFDPQPFHLRDDPPPTDFGGELIASGWHVAALFMRMLYDGLLAGSTALGAPGVETLKWQRTVRRGDTLTGRSTVLSVRPSGTRPERGIVRFRHEVFNQDGERVMALENPVFFGRRAGP